MSGGGRGVVYVDGASSGNPGPAGYGVVLEVDGRVVEERSEPIGPATNNEAEYRGLIAGLEAAAAHGVAELVVRSDSELLVRQMLGVYRVRHPRLRPLHERAAAMAARFQRVDFEHVPRERNRRANDLAQAAAASSPPRARAE